MEEFEDWYREIVDREDEICGFASGVCICGKEGYHIECQEKQRPQYEKTNKYQSYLENIVKKLGYKKIAPEDKNASLLEAEKTIIEQLNFDPFDNGYSRNEVLESKNYYYFPIGWIGCAGHLFSKTNQQIIQFGSYIGAYDHIWAYHEGISLETLGENRKNTLIILDIADVEKLMKVLNRIVAKEYLNKEILPNINKLPIRLTDVDLYFIIRDLIEARIYDWYRYEIE